MEVIEKSIEVKVPVNVAYNQWTQFEDFPQFMEGVKEVHQEGDKKLHWRAEIAGREKQWDAEIFEQIPDQRIAWRSVNGAKNSGMVNFSSLGPERTLVSLRLSYEPEGAMEKVGDALGVVTARILGDLNRFKDFIENRQVPTGGWRGEISGKEVRTEGNRRGNR